MPPETVTGATVRAEAPEGLSRSRIAPLNGGGMVPRSGSVFGARAEDVVSARCRSGWVGR
jgi:hypothetical protein